MEEEPLSPPHQPTIRDLLLPSPLELLTYAVLAFIALLLLNFEAVWKILQGDAIQPTDASFLMTWMDSISDPLGTATVFALWLGIGSVCYMIAWFVMSVFGRAREDAIEANYVGTAGTGYWESVVAHYGAFVASSVTFALFTLLAFNYFIPAVSNLFNQSLMQLSSPGSYLNILVAALGMAGVLYGFHVLGYVVRYVWRTIRVAE